MDGNSYETEHDSTDINPYEKATLVKLGMFFTKCVNHCVRQERKCDGCPANKYKDYSVYSDKDECLAEFLIRASGGRTFLDCYYECDAVKNETCTKEYCYLHGGLCHTTKDKRYEVDEDELKYRESIRSISLAENFLEKLHSRGYV